jgi:hypothetical protein
MKPLKRTELTTPGLFLIVSVLLLSLPPARAETGIEAWVQRFNGAGNGDDWANALAVDGDDDVIVTGYSFNGSNSDCATIKYSNSGVPLWTNCYSGPGGANDVAFAVKADHNNNVIVTGYSSTSTYGFDLLTLKYSSEGVPLWTPRCTGPAGFSVFFCTTAVAVDGDDNVIVAGSSFAGLNSHNDYLTIKYSSAGQPLWICRYNGPGNGDDGAQAIAVDRSGNVFVAGSSRGSGSGNDFAVIKYVSVQPPVMAGITMTNRTIQLRVETPSQASTVVIEASTNLVNWTPVFTNAIAAPVFFHSDPSAGDSPWRFYRATAQW